MAHLLAAIAIFASISSSAVDRFPAADKLKASTRELIQPYWNCVIGAAESLELSQESADLVVKAAFQECHDEMLDLQAAIDVETVMYPEKELSTDKLLSSFNDELEKAAVHLVVTIRLKRAKNAPNQ